MAIKYKTAIKPNGTERGYWNRYWLRREEDFDERSSIQELHNHYFDRGFVRGRRVMEIGCGDLSGSPYFSGATVTGVDISPIAIGRAKRRIKESADSRNIYNFVSGFDITQGLTFAQNRSADFVLAIEFMHLMGGRLRDLMGEINRVLSPGGMVQFDILHPECQSDERNRGIKSPYGTLFNVKGTTIVGCDENDINALMSASGLEITSLKIWGRDTMSHCMAMTRHGLSALPFLDDDTQTCSQNEEKFTSFVVAKKRG